MLFNMKNRRTFTFKSAIVMLFAAIMFSSCSLEENMQSNYQTATYYKSYQECVTGLRGCYIPFRSIYNGTFMLALEGVSDLMYCNSGTYDANLDISPSNARFGRTVWTQGYLGVMRSNNIIAAIERAYADNHITLQEYNELKAEGAALRGMYYYLLTSFFGNVPFYTYPIETMEDQDRAARLPRMSAIDARAHIVDELLELLVKDGVAQKRTYESQSEGDFRMGAAFGWMVCAKLAMWNGSKDKANASMWWDKALTAIGHLESIYGELDQYPISDIRFRNKYTRESIFEISNIYDEDGLKVTSNVALFFTPNRTTSNDEASLDGEKVWVYYDGLIIDELGDNQRTYTAFRPNQYFYEQLQVYTDYDKLEETDENFINNAFDHRSKINMAWGYKSYDVTNDEYKWQFFNGPKSETGRPWMGDKFWCPHMQSTADGNNYKVFRYAGALIMAAECYLEKDNRAKAIEYLNKVRHRAGLGNLNQSNFKSKAALMDEIQKEHGRELIGEFQRKFELVRWGIWFDQVYNCSNYTKLKEYMLPCHQYYPIPDKEVANSGGALDNKEYEKYGL